MKKVIIALLLVVTTFAVQSKEKDGKSDTESTATTVLTGTVADVQSGETLVGVEVKLEGTDLKTYTDFDGKFNFDNVKPGEYKIVTNYISYEKKSETLKVSAEENNLKIKLQSSN